MKKKEWGLGEKGEEWGKGSQAESGCEGEGGGKIGGWVRGRFREGI